MDKLISLI